MKRTPKHPEDMSAAELEKATREFDGTFIFEKARPMNAAERREEGRLRRGRGRGRSKVGRGVRKISISMEGKLLEKADALARKKGLNRSELIAALVETGLRRAS